MTGEFCSAFMGISVSLYLPADSVSSKIRQASLPCSHGGHGPCIGIKPDTHHHRAANYLGRPIDITEEIWNGRRFRNGPAPLKSV